MLDREALVVQMAKVLAGESVMDPFEPGEEAHRRADQALARVEYYLGIDIEQAKEIVTKVMEDPS
jgi:hypothetical protein